MTILKLFEFLAVCFLVFLMIFFSAWFLIFLFDDKMDYKFKRISIFSTVWFLLNMAVGVLSVFNRLYSSIAQILAILLGFLTVKIIFGYENATSVIFLVGVNFIQVLLLVILSRF